MTEPTITERYVRRVIYIGGTIEDTDIDPAKVEKAITGTTPAVIRSWYGPMVASVQIVKLTEEIVVEAKRKAAH